MYSRGVTELEKGINMHITAEGTSTAVQMNLVCVYIASFPGSPSKRRKAAWAGPGNQASVYILNRYWYMYKYFFNAIGVGL